MPAPHESARQLADSTREWGENAEDLDTTPVAQHQVITTRLLATAKQMVQSRMVNRKPAICAVCDDYISTFTGVPVILDDKARIIEFAHRRCCVGT